MANKPKREPFEFACHTTYGIRRCQHLILSRQGHYGSPKRPSIPARVYNWQRRGRRLRFAFFFLSSLSFLSFWRRRVFLSFSFFGLPTGCRTRSSVEALHPTNHHSPPPGCQRASSDTAPQPRPVPYDPSSQNVIQMGRSQE